MYLCPQNWKRRSDLITRSITFLNYKCTTKKIISGLFLWENTLLWTYPCTQLRYGHSRGINNSPRGAHRHDQKWLWKKKNKACAEYQRVKNCRSSQQRYYLLLCKTRCNNIPKHLLQLCSATILKHKHFFWKIFDRKYRKAKPSQPYFLSRGGYGLIAHFYFGFNLHKCIRQSDVARNLRRGSAFKWFCHDQKEKRTHKIKRVTYFVFHI